MGACTAWSTEQLPRRVDEVCPEMCLCQLAGCLGRRLHPLPMLFSGSLLRFLPLSFSPL